jgi:transposase
MAASRSRLVSYAPGLPAGGGEQRELAVRPRAVIEAKETQLTALRSSFGAGWAGHRFSSSRKAVRFTGLDITVYSSDRKGPPGRLSRQGPPVLRWAAYEAGKTHARTTAPDHAYYAAVADRKNSKRAALSEAPKIARQACHILAELGDDALTAT